MPQPLSRRLGHQFNASFEYPGGIGKPRYARPPSKRILKIRVKFSRSLIKLALNCSVIASYSVHNSSLFPALRSSICAFIKSCRVMISSYSSMALRFTFPRALIFSLSVRWRLTNAALQAGDPPPAVGRHLQPLNS